MCRFIETIRAENGVIEELERHRNRISQTLKDHGMTVFPAMENLLFNMKVHGQGRIRIRIEYGTDGYVCMEQFPYLRKKIQKLRILHFIPPDDRYKYADRTWINSLLLRSDADEILIIHDGRITDTSIANITFFDGSTWWTPDTPLLKGTERDRLMGMGIIQEARLSVQDLASFSGFRLINAMLPWEDDVTHEMSVIEPISRCL